MCSVRYSQNSTRPESHTAIIKANLRVVRNLRILGVEHRGGIPEKCPKSSVQSHFGSQELDGAQIPRGGRQGEKAKIRETLCMAGQTPL